MKTKKTILILLLLMLVMTALIPLNSYGLEKDYIGHWAEQTIQSWLDNNYVSGYPDGFFRPDATITRAEFITMANNVLMFTDTADISFSDVNPGDWYYKEVQKAFKAGYISGITETMFAPDSNLTREQAAVIVYKILNLEINPENIYTFADSSLISDWAKDYVNAAVFAEIMLGYSEDNTFRPQNPITRAEAIVLLDRLNQSIIDDIIIPEGTITPPPVVDGGGGGGSGPGPVDPTPKIIDITVKNTIVTIGIGEEFNLANNLTLKTSDVILSYTTDNKGAINDPLKGIITGKKQGEVNVTVKASREGYENKEVKFQIFVAPVVLNWTDPSGNKIVGEEQEISINMGLLDGAAPVDNVSISMVWEKYIDSQWIPVDNEDITIIYNSSELTINDGIFRLIEITTVNKDNDVINAVVRFNKDGEYKLTVYGIKE